MDSFLGCEGWIFLARITKLPANTNCKTAFGDTLTSYVWISSRLQTVSVKESNVTSPPLVVKVISGACLTLSYVFGQSTIIQRLCMFALLIV